MTLLIQAWSVQLGPQHRGQRVPPQEWRQVPVGPQQSDGYLLIAK